MSECFQNSSDIISLHELFVHLVYSVEVVSFIFFLTKQFEIINKIDAINSAELFVFLFHTFLTISLEKII